MENNLKKKGMKLARMKRMKQKIDPFLIIMIFFERTSVKMIPFMNMVSLDDSSLKMDIE